MNLIRNLAVLLWLTAAAVGQIEYELACPAAAGVPLRQTYDSVTRKYRAIECVNPVTGKTIYNDGVAGGDGTMIWPGHAGIPVFDGFTWSTPIPAPDGNAAHCLKGTGAWLDCVNDANYVHRTGDESIAGLKTFLDAVTIAADLNVSGTINQTGAGSSVWSGKKWSGTSVTVPTGKDFSLGVGSDNQFKCQLAGGGSCMPVSALLVQSTRLTGCSGTCTYTYATAYSGTPNCICAGEGGSCNIASISSTECVINTTVANNQMIVVGAP